MIPTERFAIAPQHPQTAIAHNHPNFNRLHPNIPKQRSLTTP
ncbi:hypothetical protein [Anabaena sp. AL09]|nr:hypothetical protein [Anabaena sp. AL09]